MVIVGRAKRARACVYFARPTIAIAKIKAAATRDYSQSIKPATPLKTALLVARSLPRKFDS